MSKVYEDKNVELSIKNLKTKQEKLMSWHKKFQNFFKLILNENYKNKKQRNTQIKTKAVTNFSCLPRWALLASFCDNIFF